MTGNAAREPEVVRYGQPSGRWVLLATVLGSGLAFLDATVVNIALPRIGTDLAADAVGLQWTVNGYTLSLASLILLGGSLGDRFGPEQHHPCHRADRGEVRTVQLRADQRTCLARVNSSSWNRPRVRPSTNAAPSQSVHSARFNSKRHACEYVLRSMFYGARSSA